MDKVYMTPEGYKALEEEYKNLKFVERPNVVQAIAEARALGDLSENAEYHSAKDKQGIIESRIKELESKLTQAALIVYFHFGAGQVSAVTEHEAAQLIVESPVLRQRRGGKLRQRIGTRIQGYGTLPHGYGVSIGSILAARLAARLEAGK